MIDWRHDWRARDACNKTRPTESFEKKIDRGGYDANVGTELEEAVPGGKK